MDSKENFDIYVGCMSGIFKGVKLTKEKCAIRNLHNPVAITENDEVTTISWGDDEEKEVLIACGVKGIRSVKVYDTECSTYTCSFFCDVGKGRINGISRYNGAILTAVESGEVKLWRFKEEDEILLHTGGNLNRMRHSRVNKNIIATGGEDHSLKLFDLERQKQIFVEKNVSNDWLQLRVPISILDIGFLPGTQQIVTVGRYGHVRLYDPKVQRRPVINLEMKDEALKVLSVTPREKQVIVGSGRGRMNLIDLRQPGKILNTYKGFTGAINGIACSASKPYIVSTSLDRFLRVHHMDSKKLLKQVYLTSRITGMVAHSKFSLDSENEATEEGTEKGNNNNNNNENDTKDITPENGTDVQNEDSDPEYDQLFDKMQVVSNKEDIKLIEKKRRKLKLDSMLNNEIVTSTSISRTNGKLNRSSKRQKSNK